MQNTISSRLQKEIMSHQGTRRSPARSKNTPSLRSFESCLYCSPPQEADLDDEKGSMTAGETPRASPFLMQPASPAQDKEEGRGHRIQKRHNDAVTTKNMAHHPHTLRDSTRRHHHDGEEAAVKGHLDLKNRKTLRRAADPGSPARPAGQTAAGNEGGRWSCRWRREGRPAAAISLAVVGGWELGKGSTLANSNRPFSFPGNLHSLGPGPSRCRARQPRRSVAPRASAATPP